MSKNDIIVQINAIIGEHFEIDTSAITPESDVRRTLDVDSLRATELIVIINKKFDILMRPRQLSHLVTFGDVYDYIEKQLSI